MATSELGSNFVNKGTILKDLNEGLRKPILSTEASLLMERLAIEQNCNIKAQLLLDLAATGSDSLANYIRMYVRDNTNDNTQMPPGVRLYYNHTSDPSNASKIEMSGELGTTHATPIIQHLTDPFPFYGARQAPWIIQDGWLVFTQGCEIEMKFDFMVGLDVPSTDLTTVQWRLSNTGTNRFVTVTPIVELEGSLISGSTMRVPLPSVSFYPENLTARPKLQLTGKYRLKAFQSDFTLGRVERARLILSRSPWSARSAGGVNDVVSFHKQTVAGTLDTSNYLEVIEL